MSKEAQLDVLQQTRAFLHQGLDSHLNLLERELQKAASDGECERLRERLRSSCLLLILMGSRFREMRS